MPIVTQIHIQVGGLCLLVREQSSVHVLMPSLEGVPHHLHCPYLHVAKPFSKTNRLVGIDGLALDFREIPTVNGMRAWPWPLPAILDVSSVASALVDSRFLTDDLGDELASRITLPLPDRDCKPLGGTADLHLHFPGDVHKRAVGHGRVGIHFAVDPAAELTELAVPGFEDITLTPDDKGSVELALLNLRPKDIGLPKERLNRHQHLHHLDAYFKLLTSSDGAPVIHGPPEGVNGVNPRMGDVPCAQARFAKIPRWGADFPNGEAETSASGAPIEAYFIDPYTCTVGGGCSSGDC